MNGKPLNETLQELVVKAEGKPLAFSTVVNALTGRGIPIFLILISLPFCLPIPIPGLSTPFGITLAIMGFRMAFGQRMWWPEWILNKAISYNTLKSLADAVDTTFKKVQKLVHPRLCWLAQNPISRMIHGLFVVVMALLLAIPFPVPLTNILSAFPILFMGIGLLEDDGVTILVSYGLGVVALLFWFSLFFFGHAGYQKIVSYM